MVTRRDLLGALQPALQPTPAISQYNPYAAGAKSYGSGRPAPNMGMTANKVGYGIRDAKLRAIRGRSA